MGGLALLTVLAVLLFVGYKLVVWTGEEFGRLASWLVLLGLLAALLVDAIVGRHHFAALCERGSQLAVLHRVANVDGIGVDRNVSPESPGYFGYKYVEGGFAYKGPDRIQRVEGDADGKGVVEKGVTARSRYLLTSEPMQKTYYFLSQRFKVVDRQTRQEMAHHDWYWFRGGWAERIPMLFSGAGPVPVAECPGGTLGRTALTRKMLHTSVEPTAR